MILLLLHFYFYFLYFFSNDYIQKKYLKLLAQHHNCSANFIQQQEYFPIALPVQLFSFFLLISMSLAILEAFNLLRDSCHRYIRAERINLTKYACGALNVYVCVCMKDCLRFLTDKQTVWPNDTIQDLFATL